MKALLAAATAMVLCSAAQAQDKPVGDFGWLAVGKANAMEPGHIFWVGEFSGTLSPDQGSSEKFDNTGWKCPGTNDINMNKNTSRAQGVCIISSPGGKDLAFATWECQGQAAVCNGAWDFVGGSGKFEGITGHNTFTGYTLVDWKDGTLSGHSSINRK
jgi:hypothetical protein